jgi:glycosyltransferase A (GT-A) superfamily protein (DUF2064 family)
MNSTAVLIFASIRHSSNKFLPSQSRSASRVFSSLTDRVVKISQGVFADDVFLAIPADENSEFGGVGVSIILQRGEDFGEKLCRSIQQVFELGYERLLILGNDCPHLDTPLLSQAKEKFKSASIVLGPDHKGGVYLIGVTRNNSQLLSNIEWNSNTDFAQIVQKCLSQKESLEILGSCLDLDCYSDLERIFYRRDLRLGRPLRTLLLDLRNSRASRPEEIEVPDSPWRMLVHIRIANQLPPPFLPHPH